MTEANYCPLKHILWIPLNAAIAFGLPFVACSLLKLPGDIYFGLLAAITAGLFWYYSKKTQFHWGPSLRVGWALGIITGVFFGLAMISILSLSLTTVNISLFQAFVLPLVWRGIIYGVSLAMLITVFPFIIVWRAMAGPSPRFLRKTYVSMFAVVAIFLTTFSYNLGMNPVREGFQNRIEKSFVAGIPTIISGSPLAAPITTVFLQVSETAASIEKSRGLSLQNDQPAKSKTVPGGID